MKVEAPIPSPETQRPLPQTTSAVGENPSPTPKWQRDAILAAMDGKPVEGSLDLVWEMLKDMFSLTAVWKQSDLSPAEKARKKRR